MNKELKELSLNITEKEYRDIPCLHYSALSKYVKEGFNAIESLEEHSDSSSFLFGSLVDTLITEPEEFNNRYVITERIESSDSLNLIIKDLYTEFNCSELTDIPKERVLTVCRNASYRNNYKDDTLYKYVIEKGADYYRFLGLSNGKIIINLDLYTQALNTVNVLKNNKNTEFFFRENDPFNEDIKRYFQLKFKTTIDDIEFKCMFDLIMVNYTTKEIVPIDLKTLSLKEWDFPVNFKKYNYWIQAKLYTKILKSIIEEDSYFKEFKILPFKFLTINKESLTPLIWDYKECFNWDNSEKYGDFEIPSLSNMIKMLQLSLNKKVPNHIKEVGINDITEFLYERNGKQDIRY